MTPTVAPPPTVPPTATPEPTDTPQPTETPLPDAPLVRIGDAVYVVDLAVTPEERVQGLSGRPSMDAERGMLFVYDEDGPRTFWMPDMHFPLDMVWIRADCTVAGVTADVPNPPLDTPRDQLTALPVCGDGPVHPGAQRGTGDKQRDRGRGRGEIRRADCREVGLLRSPQPDNTRLSRRKPRMRHQWKY